MIEILAKSAGLRMMFLENWLMIRSVIL